MLGNGYKLNLTQLCSISKALLTQKRATDCCQTKTVRDAREQEPCQDSHLNGVYTLKTKEPKSVLDSKNDPTCAEGCVYVKDNVEYCFNETPQYSCRTISCEVP